MEHLLTFEHVEAVLGRYAAEVERLYKERLEASGRRAEGALINSVRCVVEAGVSSYEVMLSLEEYWKYVEYGTRPHWPPVSAILRWVQVKPVIPRPDARGRIPTQKQLAYLIARKISRVGTEGSNDLRRTLEEVNAEYLPQLEEALAQDASAYVTRILVSNP